MTDSAKRVGELLARKGLISPWQLEAALKEQRSTKEFVGTILVRKGWLTQDRLFAILAEQFGIPYVHLDVEAIDWTLTTRFARSEMAAHLCLPIRIDGASVTVAVANPLDIWDVSQIEHEAGGRRAKLVLVPEEELRSAIRHGQRRSPHPIEQPLEAPPDDRSQ